MSSPSPLLIHRDRRALPSGILVSDVADRSRHALVSFLALAERKAERPELASWLFGPYLDALTIGHASLAASEPTLQVDDAAFDVPAVVRIANATRSVERVLAAFYVDADLSVSTA